MPYKFETNKLKIPEKYDRRRKLYQEDRKEILKLYDDGCSIRSIARKFGVARRTISVIVNPEAAEKLRQYIKENHRRFRKSKAYRTEAMLKHRRYKRRLYLEGKLEDPQDESK